MHLEFDSRRGIAMASDSCDTLAHHFGSLLDGPRRLTYFMEPISWNFK